VGNKGINKEVEYGVGGAGFKGRKSSPVYIYNLKVKRVKGGVAVDIEVVGVDLTFR
jgi:hypothetical protein